MVSGILTLSSRLARRSLPGIESPLPLLVPGLPNGLLRPVRYGEQIGEVGQHFRR